MIPGANLLNMALSIIAKQTITYYRMIDRELNDVGQDVTVYAAPVSIVGSFQPVPRNLYQLYGLDFQKSYFTFYTSNNVKDVQRDVSGDQIAFNNQRFQCESNNDWFALDGWKGVLCVLIDNVQTNPTIYGFNEDPSINNYQNFVNGTFINDGEG